MANKTYVIDYCVYDKDGNFIKKDGQMKVKNKSCELEAKIKLEEFLKKKYFNFHRLVITKCTEDTLGQFGDLFNDIFGKAGNDLFGGNPFTKR